MNIRSVYICMALLAIASYNLSCSGFLNTDTFDEASALCKISACTGKHKLGRNQTLSHTKCIFIVVPSR